MHPERGIFRFIRRLLGRPEPAPRPLSTQPPAPDLFTPPQQEGAHGARVRDFPRQVVEELRRVTPNHPAREITNGAMFSVEAINRNEELGRLLLDIIHQPDELAIHSPTWLATTKRRLDNFHAGRMPSDADREALAQIKANVEKLVEQARGGDERINQKIEEVQRIMTGHPTPVVDTLQEAVNQLPTSIPEGVALRDAVNNYLAHPIVNPNDEKQVLRGLAEQFENAKKSISQNVDFTNKTQQETFEQNYQLIQQAYEKVGKLWVDKFHEGSKIDEEIAHNYGSRELFEQALLEDSDLMDYWFYHIMEPVLYNSSIESQQHLFSLWVAGDMERFLNIVGRKRDAQGHNVGKTLVDRYYMLKNTILQAHDMDFFAAHPSQDIKEFIQSTAFFMNRYIDNAMQDPMVVEAKRLYELALLSTRENHNGFIPKEYLDWNVGRGGIWWDRQVERMLRQTIENKQLHHVKMDPVTGDFDFTRWGRKQIDPDKPMTLDDLYGGQPPQSTHWRRQLGDLKIAAALKQAKGLGLVDMRLLEIIGRSKGTGAQMDKKIGEKYSFKGDGFSSIPYEGIVRHIEPLIHYFTRYGIGTHKFAPFFNMLITDHHDWDPERMRRLLQLYYDGDHDTMRKEFGNEIDTRLTSMDNPFGFSGMWGTYTKWRTGEGTADFDDWELERTLSTANRLSIVGDRLIRGEAGWQVSNMSDEKKTDSFYREQDNKWMGADGKTAAQLYHDLREDYRKSLLRTGDYELIKVAQDEHLFEIKWRTIGIKEEGSTGKSYQKMLEDHLADVKKRGGKVLEHEMEQRQKKLERAYKAYIWITAAMRSPLIVARELVSEKPYFINGHKRTGALRKKIIWDILKIDIDELDKQRTPRTDETGKEKIIADLETAVFSASEIAHRQGRDLTDADFETIHDLKLREQARKYWHMVRDVMNGPFSADKWYKKIGIYFRPEDLAKPVGLRFHHIDWARVDKISLAHVGERNHSIFSDDREGMCDRSELMDTYLVDRDWRYLFSTEDMGWEYLNVGAFGERNVVRRAGDLASHVQFNQGLEELLTNFLTERLDMEKTGEQLKKMWVAMSGDFGDIANEACGRIAYTIGQMYRKADWSWRIPVIGQLVNIFKPSSIMQILYDQKHADSLGPNELYKWVHKVEELDILPPTRKSKLTGKPTFWSEWDTELLEHRLGATQANMIYEIITMGAIIAILITLWRAFTAPSEEEEGTGH